jgi:hypothetical protein
MSGSEENNSIAPEERKVVVTPEDAAAAFEFWKQFNIPPMPGLPEAFDAFCKNPTFENQENLKYMVCKAIATTQHECFTEESFAKVAEECAETAYELGFKRDFESTIGEE